MEYRVDNLARKARSSRTYDIVYIVAVTVCAVAIGCFKMAGLLDLSWFLIAAPCIVLAMHLSSYVVDRPRPFWLSSVFIFVDCVMVACCNRRIQHIVYEATSGGIGASPRLDLDGCSAEHTAASTIQTTFIMYLMMSYLTTFLLPWRYAIIVVLGVVPTYLSSLLGSLAFTPSPPEAVVWLLLECVLLIIGCAMTLLTHRNLERSEQQLLSLQEQQKHGLTDKDSLPESGKERPAVSRRSRHPPWWEPPPSVDEEAHSAPAVLPGSFDAVRTGATDPPARAVDQACDGGVDCLPREAVVWVEGEAAPRELQQLQEGQKVLCYDSLGDRVEYVSVEHLSQDTRSLDWVDVALADGTRLKMTSDHPVQLAGSEGVLAGSIVPAASLQPESHSIMVHGEGTHPVRVHSVAHVSCPAEKPRGRASLSVRQSARYSILVAESPEDPRLMAVGSADLAKPAAALLRVGQDNTFLHASEPRPREAASHSWPPCKRRHHHYAGRPAVGAPSPASREDHSGSQEEQSWQTSGSKSSEVLSSSKSSVADGVGVVESVILPSPLTKLTDLMKASSAGMPSIGSGGHFDGECRPCSYNHQGRCNFGIWCQKCHHRHFKVRGRLTRLQPGHERRNLSCTGSTSSKPETPRTQYPSSTGSSSSAQPTPRGHASK